MPDSVVKISRHGAVMHAVLNRPEKYNAIDLAMAEALFQAVNDCAEDDACRVLLIRAEGRYFCAGADIHSATFPPDTVLARPSAFRRWYRNGQGSLHPLFDAIESLEKPVVVAHQGPCLGGGLELSLACDFRLASTAAHYALPETALGALPGSGGISRTTRLIGPHWAKWLVVGNLPITAEKAERIGLVHDLYPADVFEARVAAFCDHLAAQPPEAVAAAKLAIRLVADLGPGQARDVERLANSALVGGVEYTALIAAARERLNRPKVGDGPDPTREAP